MNRIILIGNGFDLAHGLKTKYSDFLDDYWSFIIKKLKANCKTGHTYNDENVKIEILVGGSSLDDVHSFPELEIVNDKNNINVVEIEYKNTFLKTISKKNYSNWVDIEDEYYQQLLRALRVSGDVNELNNEFELVKLQLIQYLKKVQVEQGNNEVISRFSSAAEIATKIWSPFQLNDLTNTGREALLEEHVSLYEQYHQSEIGINSELKDLFRYVNKEKYTFDVKQQVLNGFYYKFPDAVLFLNFNYTWTQQLYMNCKWNNKNSKMPVTQNPQTEVIHIHGNIQYQQENPIIFGFGDERDDSYAEIEKNRNNEYLENIKSIEYLKTDNYRKLLNFLVSDNYQVFILGHSCGVSDRTLLSTIFEHENCCSVKFFYHQWHEKESGKTEDNYLKVIKNISRNFSNKAMLRDRVVNKSYTEPLVGIKPKKEA